MRAVETHALNAFLPDGRKIEVGRVRSLEVAARLYNALDAEKRSEFIRFEFVELAEEPTVATVRSLTRAEVLDGEASKASAPRFSARARR